MKKIITAFKFIIIFLWLNSPHTMSAQVAEEKTSADTSYFKPGDDSYNLVESIIKNDTGNVKMLLERGVDPNTVSSTGNSALMYASEKGNLAILKLLVESGAEVNTSGFNGETPLFLAIFNNDFQSAKYLLEQGADPNVKDDFGVTPLIYAAATDQYQSADLLLFYEADPGVSDAEGNDALMAAVTFEHLPTSDVLLQNGMDPDTRDHKDNTPLIVATQHGTYGILELLLDYDADVNLANHRNYTPLAYAITYGDVRASRMLIEKGADVQHEVDKGRNMAELARISGSDSLIMLVDQEGGEIPPGPDFSEFRLVFGNSFNKTDYLMAFRGSLTDTKHGYFIETGIDYRPILLKVQIQANDSLFQFREKRIGWSHGVGKYFRLHETANGSEFSAYVAANGYLSYPKYAGSAKDPGAVYNIIPSAGLSVRGRYLGIRAGAEYYNFENKLDKGLKFNLSVFFRIAYPEVHYDRKEINWE